jgi:hypothetical protein
MKTLEGVRTPADSGAGIASHPLGWQASEG